jgi:hypothetical protein
MGLVETGQLVIVPLCHPSPFGVAKVIDYSDDGDLKLQWLANESDEPRGTFKPGWTTPQELVYYEEEKKHADHLPYMVSDDSIVVSRRDVFLHSFKLTADQRLPPSLIGAISIHDGIWWSEDETTQPGVAAVDADVDDTRDGVCVQGVDVQEETFALSGSAEAALPSTSGSGSKKRKINPVSYGLRPHRPRMSKETRMELAESARLFMRGTRINWRRISMLEAFQDYTPAQLKDLHRGNCRGKQRSTPGAYV